MTNKMSFYRALKNLISVWCLFLFMLTGDVHAEPVPHLYTTGTVMEVDRCASAWLIKRFVDEEAIFKFYPESSLITNGIAFDRPEGKLQRTHNKATFEVILNEYDIIDLRLHYIAGLIHDIEINFWGKKDNPESRKFEAAVRERMSSSQNNDECLAICFRYFDQFLQALPIED